MGIKAQGRTTILKINYRNTQEVLHCAYEFAKSVLSSHTNPKDSSIPLILPESAGVAGPAPQLRKKATLEEECKFATKCIQQWLVSGEHPNDIAVIYLNWQHANQLATMLSEASIDHLWLKNKSRKTSIRSRKCKNHHRYSPQQ